MAAEVPADVADVRAPAWRRAARYLSGYIGPGAWQVIDAESGSGLLHQTSGLLIELNRHASLVLG